MSTFYLGNVLGGTGPSGPTGPIGCPSCLLLETTEWLRQESDGKVRTVEDLTGHSATCWEVGELITISGRDSNNNPVSEESTIDAIDESTNEVTTAATLHAYYEGYEITICHGHNIGPTGPSQGPTGPTGPAGPLGSTGPTGPDCSGTVDGTTLSLTGSSTSEGQTVSVTTQSLKCWTQGQIIILSYTGSNTDYFIGKVTEYVDTTLSFLVLQRAGTVETSNWNINVSGDLGPSGPTGPLGGTGPT